MSFPFAAFGRSIAIAALLIAAMTQTGSAQARLSIVYAFKGGSDGEAPAAPLIHDMSGNLYGTTEVGGTGSCSNGCGTVFKLTPQGVESVLYAFKGGSDGGFPTAGLVMDKHGNLYGTTYGGNGAGNGTVFKVAPDGSETVLHIFGGGDDGLNPSATLTRGRHGELYGTTTAGGNYNAGTLFKIAKDGREFILWSFGGPGDGAEPSGPLLLDKAGNFYGTTVSGGTGDYDCSNGCGTVFEFTPNVKETVLWSFDTTNGDGENPLGGVIADARGNLYGTTSAGGTAEAGTVFELAADGTEHLLHSFEGTDGLSPMAGVTLDKDGHLFGTTPTGSNGLVGTIFKLSSDGLNFSTIHTFRAQKGRFPYAGLILSRGVLYGTTFEGGNACRFGDTCGVVFTIRK